MNGAQRPISSSPVEATAGESRRRGVRQTPPLMAAALHALPNSRYGVRRHVRIPGRNSELLDMAHRHGFTALVTSDKRLALEQAGLPIAVIAVDDNRIALPHYKHMYRYRLHNT